MSKLSEWSKAVIARDRKCVRCGSVKGLKAYREEDVALCEVCYRKAHESRRPVDMSSERPQRKTLLRRIAELEKLTRQE